MKFANLSNLLVVSLVLFSSVLFSQTAKQMEKKEDPKSWKVQLTEQQANDLLYSHLFNADLNQRLSDLNDWSSLVNEVTLVNELIQKYTLTNDDKLKFENYLSLTKVKTTTKINDALQHNTCHPSEIALLQKYAQEIK